MGFDDYSYKFYNESILNPKALKRINEEDTHSCMLDVKSGIDEGETLLT